MLFEIEGEFYLCIYEFTFLIYSILPSLLFFFFLPLKFETVFSDLMTNQVALTCDNSNMDKLIQTLTKQLSDDMVNTSDNDQLFRIANDLVDASSSEGDRDLGLFNEKKYWSFRRQITLDNMIHAFNSLPNAKTTFRLLQQFISKMRDLELLKHVPAIARMIRLAHNNFNRQLDMKTAASTLLGSFMLGEARRGSSDELERMDETFRAGTLSLLKVWKAIIGKPESRLQLRMLNKKIDPDNIVLQNVLKLTAANEEDYRKIPLSYLLPNTTKDGVYIYTCVFYLLNMQNEFVAFYKRENDLKNPVSQSAPPAFTVEFDNLTDNDCMTFACDKEILHMCFVNSNYSLESHQQDTALEYDFVKVQQAIERTLLADKLPVEARKVPLVEYTDDLNNMSSFIMLNQKVNQVGRVSFCILQLNQPSTTI